MILALKCKKAVLKTIEALEKQTHRRFSYLVRFRGDTSEQQKTG